MNNPFVAIHLGAGRHSKQKENEYKKLCKQATNLGIELLKNGSGMDCNSVAVEVAKVLEDSEITNAGYGSNLTSEGKVECDASIADSKSLKTASIGCTSRIKNPISVANCLLNDLNKPLDKFGRAKPIMLVSQGAEKYAAKNKLELCDNMISNTEQTRYEYLHKEIGDTIGIIVCDNNQNICVASSSGGPIYKQPGRIGPAAVPGAGVSININQQNNVTIASTTTGHGEDIIDTHLATLVASHLLTNDGSEVDAYNQVFDQLQERQSSSGLQSDSFVGILSLYVDETCGICSFAHKTDSMIWGYSNLKETKCVVSRRKESEQDKVHIGAVLAFKVSN